MRFVLTSTRENPVRVTEWHNVEPEHAVESFVIAFGHTELDITVVIWHEIGPKDDVPHRKDEGEVLVYVLAMT